MPATHCRSEGDGRSERTALWRISRLVLVTVYCFLVLKHPCWIPGLVVWPPRCCWSWPIYPITPQRLCAGIETVWSVHIDKTVLKEAG